jgi:cyclase
MWARVIPILLLDGEGLYKTRRFSDPRYIGDPINAVKIFNEKEVDELVFLDIGASRDGSSPNLELLHNIAGECFIPLGYGGGVRSVEMARAIIAIGIEKIIVNSACWEVPGLIPALVDTFGSSSIVCGIDVKKNWAGSMGVYVNGGRTRIPPSPVSWARQLEAWGAGELLITSVDRDGEMGGYDLSLIRSISDSVNVPVIAAGGAGSISDLRAAVVEGGAAAAAGGALFVFQGKHRAVLITYPSEGEREIR